MVTFTSKTMFRVKRGKLSVEAVQGILWMGLRSTQRLAVALRESDLPVTLLVGPAKAADERRTGFPSNECFFLIDQSAL